MKHEMKELTEHEMIEINGGGDAEYGSILATVGIAAVGGAFVLTAGAGFLVALAIVGTAATIQGAWFAYKA